MSNFSNLVRVWHQIERRRKVQFYFLMPFMIVASFAEILSIGAFVPFLAVLAAPQKAFNSPLLRPLIGMLHLKTPHDLIVPMAVLFCLGCLISGAVRYTLLFAQTRITYATGVDLSVRIFERTLNQPYLVHVSRNSSEVIAGVSSKTNELIVSLLYPAAIVISSAVMLLIVLGTLIAVEPVITLVTGGTFAVFYGGMSIFSRRRALHSGQIIASEFGRTIKHVQEGLGGIRDILLDGTQGQFVKSYQASQQSLQTARATVQVISGTPRYVIETLGTLFLALFAVYLAAGPEGLGSALPILGAIALAAQRLVPVVQLMYSSWMLMQSGRASVNDALDLLEQPAPYVADASTTPDALPFRSQIALENVSFRYAPQLHDVLRDVSVVIPKHARLGVMGETGSGKSTFLDILMGLMPPTDGRLTVDGRTLDRTNMRAWQLQIAHVPQFIYLADTSVEQNIAFGLPPGEIDHQRAIEAARIAQIDDFIKTLPSGYGTHVGERGVQLSGGQRQRIGIARALYKRAPVIVLDEATSALDEQTESNVMDAIQALPQKITLVVVAHRESTLRHCTSIIRIGQGGVHDMERSQAETKPYAGSPK